MSTSIVKILEKKRDRLELSNEEVDFFIRSVTNGNIEDSQIGAMLMAIYLNGMSEQETAALTRSMTHSGDVIEFPVPEWQDLLVDKHSTGGVGDKISLILVPVLAALGFKVPMVSGRGLDITGGTLDKLESIPGFRIQLSKEDMMNSLQSPGCFIGSATGSLAPADRVLYQQRDITRTVSANPLIVSSILSKKVAEGTKALVMDIKVGRGTFMKSVEDAEKLARSMVEISRRLGVSTSAVLSRMDSPIGRTIGDALEVMETVECLRNRGPSDVMQLVNVLGGTLLQMKGKVNSLEAATKLISLVISNGDALNKFQEMLMTQGASKQVAETLCHGDIHSVLSISKKVIQIPPKKSGYIHDLDAHVLGTVWWSMGGGRSKASDAVDHSVGLRLLKVIGDKVSVGEPWIEAYYATDSFPENLRLMLESCITVAESVPDVPNLIIDIL